MQEKRERNDGIHRLRKSFASAVVDECLWQNCQEVRDMSMSMKQAQSPDPRIGYAFAGLNAIISGIAIYVNSLGVKLFADATLYTTLKNLVVGLALLLPFAFFASRRAEWKRLTGRQWSLLLLLAVIGGSVPYVLFFSGLKLGTPVTSSLLNHAQFLLVAFLAVLFLRERPGIIVWLALLTLLVGTIWGMSITSLRWGTGDTLVAASTVLFAAGVVLAKYLLHDLSTVTVMTAKMSIGSLFLVIYVAATGRMGMIAHLSYAQWTFVVVTGLILLAFTVTAFLALRYASATVATAIPAAAPLITTALVIFIPQVGVKPTPVPGVILMALAVLILFIAGSWQEVQTWRKGKRTLTRVEATA
jgi:drug/metabolite transporter (DMT)-like permease